MTRLEEIKARRQAIIGESWQWNSYSRIDAAIKYGHPWDQVKYGDDEGVKEGLDPEGPVMTKGGGFAIICYIAQRPDHQGHGDELHSPEAVAHARFIEKAPTDIDWLIAEIQRLRTLVEYEDRYITEDRDEA